MQLAVSSSWSHELYRRLLLCPYLTGFQFQYSCSCSLLWTKLRCPELSLLQLQSVWSLLPFKRQIFYTFLSLTFRLRFFIDLWSSFSDCSEGKTGVLSGDCAEGKFYVYVLLRSCSFGCGNCSGVNVSIAARFSFRSFSFAVTFLKETFRPVYFRSVCSLSL